MLTRAPSGKKLRLASLGHTLAMGLSSRIQAGAVTGPPYLANFRQRLCPAARASLRAMLALLLQTLASITQTVDRQCGDWSSDWLSPKNVPRNVRASQKKTSYERGIASRSMLPSTADCE